MADGRRTHMHQLCGDLARALDDGAAGAALLALATHINTEHPRGSIAAQLPALRAIAAESGDPVAIAAVERLADEAAGRA